MYNPERTLQSRFDNSVKKDWKFKLRSMADAVMVEPVSTPKFPDSAEFGPLRRFTVLSRQTNSMLCSRIPYSNKQGFDLTEQGFSTQDQEILSAKIKINTG
jgi:hypothetical protein